MVAFVVESNVRFSEASVPPLNVWPPAWPANMANSVESMLSNCWASEAVPSTVALIVPATVRSPLLSKVIMLIPLPLCTENRSESL